MVEPEMGRLERRHQELTIEMRLMWRKLPNLNRIVCDGQASGIGDCLESMSAPRPSVAFQHSWWV